MEAPANDALGGNKDAPSGNVPSVLVVPIEINPAQDLPALEVNKVGTPAADVTKIEPLKVDPVKIESPKTAPIKPVELLPVAEKPAPAKPATKPATNEEPFSLRIDRNLEVAPIEAAPSTKPKKVDVPPPEEEPGYFEKMLEKIGF